MEFTNLMFFVFFQKDTFYLWEEFVENKAVLFSMLAIGHMWLLKFQLITMK